MPPALPAKSTLALETRNHNPIDNEIDRSAPIPGMVFETNDHIKNFPKAEPRTRAPDPTYNCHGMTFAARRTTIEKSQEVVQILADDGYVKIPEDQVLPGDIVIYRDLPKNGGEIIHSGIVVDIPTVLGTRQQPRVVSKWGHAHECIHSVQDCLYPVPVEYWRVMP